MGHDSHDCCNIEPTGFVGGLHGLDVPLFSAEASSLVPIPRQIGHWWRIGDFSSQLPEHENNAPVKKHQWPRADCNFQLGRSCPICTPPHEWNDCEAMHTSLSVPSNRPQPGPLTATQELVIVRSDGLAFDREGRAFFECLGLGMKPVACDDLLQDGGSDVAQEAETEPEFVIEEIMQVFPELARLTM